MPDASALIAEHGTTFAAEAGIDVAKGTPAPLFGLLATSMLLASRIQHRLAVQAAVELRKARLLSANALADAAPDDVWSALDRGNYLRKERTTSMLQDAARQCLDRYRGDLRRLREEADGDVEALDARLRDFKGIGATGAEVFLREVQVAWPEVGPYFGKRGIDAARRLGLSADPRRLAELGEPAVVAAALVRADLGDG